MSTSTRFAVAVHVLTLLALQDEALTSEYIAGSVSTNPVVVRRILGALKQAGLVTAAQGPRGGFTLAVAAREIDLRAVYEAVEERNVIAIHSNPNPQCPVGRTIENILDGVTTHAEEAMLRDLSATSLAKLVGQVQRRNTGAC